LPAHSTNKGKTYELDVFKWLSQWRHLRYIRQNAPGWEGCDGVMLDGLVSVEIKNQKTMNLAGWVDQARAQADNEEALAGVVIHKRRGRAGVQEHYVTMQVDDFAELVEHLLLRRD